MENDNEFIKLSNALKNNIEEYNRLESLKLDLNNITKDISESKTKLFNLEIVKNYLSNFNNFNNLLKQIDSIISKEII